MIRPTPLDDAIPEPHPDDVLTTLSDLTWARATDQGPVMDRVTARARRLRRRRRGLAVGAPVLAAAAAVSLLVSPLLEGTGGHTSGTHPPASASQVTPDAASPTTPGPIPLGQAPGLLYLAPEGFGELARFTLAAEPASFSAQPDAPIRAVALRTGPVTPSGGVPADRATWPGRSIQAGLSVRGPSLTDPAAQLDRKGLAKDRYTAVSTVKVRGTTGQLVAGRTFTPGQANDLSWREPGTADWWSVEGFSLTGDQLVAAADALRITGATVDATHLPQNLISLDYAQDAKGNGVTQLNPTWRATYSTTSGGDPVSWTLSVTTGSVYYDSAVTRAAGHALGSVHLVDLGGVTGYLVDESGPTLTWARGGVYFKLEGELREVPGQNHAELFGLTAEQEVTIAHGLVHVAPDDPRLARATQTR